MFSNAYRFSKILHDVIGTSGGHIAVSQSVIFSSCKFCFLWPATIQSRKNQEKTRKIQHSTLLILLTQPLAQLFTSTRFFAATSDHSRYDSSNTTAARRTAACWHKEPKRDQRRAKRREPKDQPRKPHQLPFAFAGLRDPWAMSALSFPKLPGYAPSYVKKLDKTRQDKASFFLLSAVQFKK